MRSPKPKPDLRAREPGQSPGTSNRSVVRACSILKCFKDDDVPLSLGAVAAECNLNKPTTYRLLKTLVDCGMLAEPRKNSYLLRSRTESRRKLRIGYATQSEEFSFSRIVSESISSSAYGAGIELLVLNNRYSPTIAIRNAETFVREKLDLVIEFQTYERSASLVASKIIEASIPLIAVEIPHPGADFYGANNYRAGLIAGHALGRACAQHWAGVCDEVLLLELEAAGPLPRSRLIGTLAGLREILHKIPDQNVCFLNGNGRFEASLEVVRRHLRRNTSRRVLVGGLNDPSSLGALQAFREAGRSAHCLVIDQNGSIEARREMRNAGSRMVGSVAYFAERYGDAIIALAIDKIQGREIPPATFVKHQLLTAENVDALYPNDKLITSAESDSLLFSQH